MGGGHVSRAFALAEALLERGGTVSMTFLGGAPLGEAARTADRLGVVARPIPQDSLVVADLPRADDAIGLAGADRLVVFDDRSGFTGSAAIVVQPSQPAWSGTGRADRVLAGYDWVPLAARYRELREIRELRGDSTARRAATPRVVLCFGGSDPAGVTERLGPALLGVARELGWTIELLVGAGHRGPDDAPELPLIRDAADLAERLAGADVAVVAAGTMKFEVACLGRPAILVAVADDQLSVGPPFAATGAAVWLGDGRTIDPATVADAVAALVADPERRRTTGERGAEVVDGRGADRLAEAILNTVAQR